MATGSLTVNLTIPTVNGSPNASAASNALAIGLLQQVIQAIGSTGATSGVVSYPPGANAQNAGNWSYTAAT